MPLETEPLLGELDGVELRRVRLTLSQPWRTAHGVVQTRDVVLVRVVYEHCEGWGECVALPEPTYSPEYTEGALDALRRHLVPRLCAAPPATGAAVERVLASVKGHRMAKAAVELAVLDAEGRARGRSLASLLGANRTTVPAGVALGLTGSIPDLLAEIEQWVAEGYRRVKLKVMPGWDVGPVRAVREHFGELDLQVDGNGVYRPGDRDDASALKALDEWRLLAIEQPFADDDLLAHADLAARLSTPVALDESVSSANSALAAMALGACRAINVKPGRVGGYLEAVRVHDAATSHGVALWCGGMLETGLGRAANLALAGLDGFVLPADLSASERYYRDDITEPIVLNADGTIDVPDQPGNGAVLRPAAIDAATVERDWWPRR
jgi:o-succinylbenzoate synthase